MISSAAELFKAAGLRTKTIEVLGNEVTIRELSVGGRMRLAETDAKGAATVLVRECLVTPEGNPMLSQAEAEKLSELSYEFVDAVAAEVLKFSRLPAKKD